VSVLRRLELSDMDAAARIHRIAFDRALPALAGLHTKEEDRSFFRECVFVACELWGSFGTAGMTGMIAFRKDWIDQLYVLPEARLVAFEAGASVLRAPSTLDLSAQQPRAPLLRSARVYAGAGD
jgi:hypothetical protein